MAWTKQQLSRLKRLCRTKSLSEIAEVLGRLPGEIHIQTKKLKIQPRPPKPKTFKEIATIANHCERNGVEATAKNYHLRTKAITKIVTQFNQSVANYAQQLTPEEIGKIRTRAIRVAAGKNFAEYGADFASYAVYKKMTLQYEKLNYDYLWMNFAQMTFGDWGSETGRKKVLAEQNYFEISEGFDDETGRIQVKGEDGRETMEKVDFSVIANRYQFRKEERLLFLLYFKWGFNFEEIGELYDVSESRICQRMAEIFKSLRSQIHR